MLFFGGGGGDCVVADLFACRQSGLVFLFDGGGDGGGGGGDGGGGGGGGSVGVAFGIGVACGVGLGGCSLFRCCWLCRCFGRLVCWWCLCWFCRFGALAGPVLVLVLKQ